MRHWIEKIAEELKERDVENHVIASGTSISGSIHIGNVCDVFIANAVSKSLKKLGLSSKTIWIADDYDPLRKVPYPLPASFEKFLGMPYSQIPCPEKCCKSFVDHFQKPFLNTLQEFSIELEPHSGAQMYKDGLYEDYIRISLKKSSPIRNIFNKYRENPLDDDWLPYNPICSNCNRINSTHAYKYQRDSVYYYCDCGFNGEMDIKSGEGKLTWRVEWAARWKIFGISCEPFGKDHAASGGSYDVSSIISQEIFDYEAPYPVPYEWITLKGEAMSKSQGIFFTPRQWLEIGPPESLNYFLFRSKPMKHKDFNPEMPFLDFIDQFDRAEQIYFGEHQAASEKEYKKLKKIYQMSQIDVKGDLPFRPSYRFLTVAYQIAGDNLQKIYEILQKNSQLSSKMENTDFEDLDESKKYHLKERILQVKNWLEKYAPPFVKFQVQKKIPPITLSAQQEAFLSDLADLVEAKNFNPEELHDEMYNILRKHGLKPQKAFQAIYKIIIGKKIGPRAASFILSLDRDFVIKRLRKEI